MNTSSYRPPNDSHFRRRKEDALDLLQWALDHMSPDPQHRLQIKMGIEREGHFIPPELKDLDMFVTSGEWGTKRKELLPDLAEHMRGKLKPLFLEQLESLYHDPGGSFILELTTKPLSPKEAAKATEMISRSMLEIAERNLGISDGCFGTMKLDFLSQMEKRFGDIAPCFAREDGGEIFRSPEGDILAGRGQHANVSVWCGDKNLFADEPMYIGQPTLGTAALEESIKMGDGMTLPLRNGNYWRIAAKSGGAVQELAASRFKDGSAFRWVNASAVLDKILPDEQRRMECRQAAPEADPLDVALASAIPVTRACMKYIHRDPETGKMRMQGALPEFLLPKDFPLTARPMPHSHEEAAKAFNHSHNPNFTFLNDLAQYRLEHMQKQCEAEMARDGKVSERSKQELQEAQGLQDIGTELHQMYCQQYGLESEMGKAHKRSATFHSPYPRNEHLLHHVPGGRT